jgi:hypothetical protein
VGRVTPKRSDPNRPDSAQRTAILWTPLIVGLALGASVAAATGFWWWSTIGVLGGAAVGWVGYSRRR